MESRQVGKIVDAAGNQLELVSGSEMDHAIASGGFYLSPFVTKLDNNESQG